MHIPKTFQCINELRTSQQHQSLIHCRLNSAGRYGKQTNTILLTSVWCSVGAICWVDYFSCFIVHPVSSTKTKPIVLRFRRAQGIAWFFREFMFVTEILIRGFHGCRAYQARHPLLEFMHSNLPILRSSTVPAPVRGPS